MDRTNNIRFAADASLGKLAKWLRLLGFDTLYVREIPNSRFMEFGERRILLTRTERIRDQNRSYPLIFIRSNHPFEQLKEVIQALGLISADIRPFSRCIRCDFSIKTVDKESVRDRVPDYTWETCDTFQMCAQCGRIYWPGSHTERCRETIQRLFDSEKMKI